MDHCGKTGGIMSGKTTYKIKNMKFFYGEMHKILKKDAAFDAFLNKVADEVVEAVQESIDGNTTSHTGRTEKEIEESRGYFKGNISKRIVKGKKRKFAVVYSGGDNALEYEAEHGNFPQAINKLRSK